jgi:hypothetical protein
VCGITVPTHPSELTPEWLTAVLRHSGTLNRAAVRAVSWDVLGTGRGFTGQVMRLHLYYDGHDPTAPRSLIAKLPAVDPAVRAALHELGVFAREVHFYQDVALNAAAPVPHLYYAALDPGTSAAVLLLEDLTAGRVGDNLAGCTANEAVLAVTQLARFHARWWNHPCLDEMAWLAPADHEGYADVFQRQWHPFRAKLAGRLPPRLEILGERILERLADYHRWLSSPPTCIVHGDFRLDNLFFADDGSARPLIIFDWQVAVHARGITDVAYFAAFCLPVEMRRDIEREFVGHYHAALVAGGVRDYSGEQCWDDYRLATLNALVRLIGAAGLLDFSSERGALLAAALIERIDAILADHDAAALLDRSFPVPLASVTNKGAVR